MKNYKNWILLSAKLLTIFIFLALVFHVGKSISYEDQSKYIDNIRNVSAIIFGVSGAWLAITYPKALSSAKAAKESAPDKIEISLKIAKEDIDVLMGFVRTMIISIVIVTISLIIPLAKEIFSGINWLMKYRIQVLGTLFLAIASLLIIQVYQLAITLKNTYKALQDIQQNTAQAINQLERKNNENY